MQWGLEPHAIVSVTMFEQAIPKRDMLYLDKAWRELQELTRPPHGSHPTRPAYRMFEGTSRCTTTAGTRGYGR